MTHWMCTNCGYYLQAPRAPGDCPSCKQACAFNDVTCYRPECGGEANMDPLLVGFTLSHITSGRVQAAPKPAPGVTRVIGADVASERPGREQERQVRSLWDTVTEAVGVGVLFEGLGEEQKQSIRSLGHTETYATNAVICNEGEEADKLYLVEEGQVAVQFGIGKRVGVPISVAISVVSPGEAFAWSALVPPHRLTATAVAASPTRVLAIEREKLLAVMRTDASLALPLMQNIARVVASRLCNLEQALAGILER